jgi:tRNA modification GTPase
VTPADTIAAIATAPGRAGIGVVRVSGPALAAFAEQLTRKTLRPRHAQRVDFHDMDGGVIDSGIALLFTAPHSYTGEDVLELQAHGSPVILRLLLERCLELGARLAEPGEFTRRAFLNDKMDLAQAEAVADLIAAITATAARSAVRSLAGEFSGEIRALVEELVELRMLAEANIDFPEEQIDFLDAAGAPGRLQQLQAKLAAICARARQGAILRRGLQVVLAGAPNVGKSSLLNRLAGEDLAIVTAVPGTTRDTVRQTLDLDGIPVNIIDTAGLRDTSDEVEALGIARTWAEIATADAVVLMLDVRSGVDTAEREIMAKLPSGVPLILVHNKIDLASYAPKREITKDRIVQDNNAAVSIHLSAKLGLGIDLLREELKRIAGWEASGEDVFMARERHLAALAIAGAALQRATGQLNALEFFAEELRLAQAALGGITGEFSADDLLGEIFSRFCIGK